MSDESKPYLSPSQLDTYCRCPEQWRRRYVEGEIIPPGVALLVGGGYHGGIEANHRQKLESRLDMPAKQIVDAAVNSFDRRIKGDGVLLSEDEQSRGQEVVVGEARDQTAELAAFYAKHQAPDYQPALVEEKVRIELPMCSHDLLGIVDLADEQGRIVDFKTAGKRKSQADADGSVQLTVYAVAYKARVGTEATGLRLDTAVKLKRGPERQVLSTERSAADFAALRHRLTAVTAAIAAGIFPPATPGAWWCGPKWCGYWSTCRFVNSERRTAAEGSE